MYNVYRVKEMEEIKMKVYLVKELINSEYGDYDVDKIFLSKEKAQNYVEEKEEIGRRIF